MNRAERRREQKAKSKVHIMTRDDMMYDKGLRVGMTEGIKMESGRSVRMMTTAVAAVLHRDFGYGAVRLDRILTHVSATLSTIQDDADREKRMREWILKETGLDLDDYTGARTMDLREEMQREYDMGIIVKRGKEE